MTTWLQQKHSCSSLTLIIACIIYWRAKEIHRVIQTATPPEHMTLAVINNISPVSWENVILYGEYILNRNRVVR
ncbi:Tn3 family transposase [Nitrosomonas aestuarii]|uniref:Tn3 family transposase n=1 Tax=Nitrosomonas aestuarii TaxID=52441 RepID=UPI001480EBB3